VSQTGLHVRLFGRSRAAAVHINYRYILDFCQSSTLPAPAILDFGCGEGEIVEAGVARGMNVFGVDIFFEASNARKITSEKGLLGSRVQEILDGQIPFAEASFDVVVSNQVFEHVEDIDLALSEIARVLKPDGFFLCLFPSIEVIREGHCGVPMVHWLPKGSRARYYWLLLFRTLGFGYHKDGRSRREWSQYFLNWLDRFTAYRTYSQLERAFLSHFRSIEHVEDQHVEYRFNALHLRHLGKLGRTFLLANICRLLFRRLCGMVLIARGPIRKPRQ